MKRVLEPLISHYNMQSGSDNYIKPTSLPDGLKAAENRRDEIVGNYSERDIIMHYTRLAAQNYSVDSGFYPLGSCTMKYNPRIDEKVSSREQFINIHPYFPDIFTQGTLRILYELEQSLRELTGFSEFTLTPAAGAHGELTGMLIIKKYLEVTGQNDKTVVLIPDSAHGTNPASSKMSGFTPFTISSNRYGILDLEQVKKVFTSNVAALMITNPNTVGLLEKNLPEIAGFLHKNGALLYMDGANYNAFIGRAKPIDMGVDVMHFNMHKTFATPHGGGGPGAAAVGVVHKLRDFLPVPFVEKSGDKYVVALKRKHSIGRIHSFLGNIGILLRSYAYILSQGLEGFKKVSGSAVLNANYLMTLLKDEFEIPFPDPVMHEFVIDGSKFKKFGVSTLDVSKRIMDFGFHPPTIYFPHIVKDALMIEPTETESTDTLESFANSLLAIKKEMRENHKIILDAPHTTTIDRPNDAKAARDILKIRENRGGDI